MHGGVALLERKRLRLAVLSGCSTREFRCPPTVRVSYVAAYAVRSLLVYLVYDMPYARPYARHTGAAYQVFLYTAAVRALVYHTPECLLSCCPDIYKPDIARSSRTSAIILHPQNSVVCLWYVRSADIRHFVGNWEHYGVCHPFSISLFPPPALVVSPCRSICGRGQKHARPGVLEG